jgi:hypothetical protein
VKDIIIDFKYLLKRVWKEKKKMKNRTNIKDGRNIY